MSGKAVFNSLVRPLPIKAFRDTNFSKPCFVKCSLFTIKEIPFLKHRKFLLFLVINGYLSKCSIKINNSFLDSTRYCTPSFLWAYILPIPSVDWILLNIPSSFLCNIIENTYSTFPFLVSLSIFLTINENEPSPNFFF